MMCIVHSGVLNFSAALLIAFIGIMTWNIGRSVPVAIMNFGFVLLNLGFGVMQVMSHPEIWQ